MIYKLDESVIQKIAAGEAIQGPAEAVKELLENSVDAKSTNIQITIKDGGYKLIQIQDNGCGIALEDLPLVCERYSTSKIRDFKDLTMLTSFGFRGEALASLSQVAQFGKLTPDLPAKTSRTKLAAIENIYGRAITPHLKELNTEAKEYNVKVSGYYSDLNYHCSKTVFVLFVNGRLVENPTLKKAIEKVYSTFLLTSNYPFVYLEINVPPHEVDVNIHTSKKQVLMFYDQEISGLIAQKIESSIRVNDRSTVPSVMTISQESTPKIYDYNLVRSSPNSRTLDAYISPHSNKIEPFRNAKGVFKRKIEEDNKENDSEIIRKLFPETSTSARMESRTKQVQPEASDTIETIPSTSRESRLKNQVLSPPENRNRTETVEANVTTITPKNQVASDSSVQNLNNDIDVNSVNEDNDIDVESVNEINHDGVEILNATKDSGIPNVSQQTTTSSSKRRFVDVQLTSVLYLRALIEKDCDTELTEYLASAVFVGIVNERFMIAQSGTRLLMFDYVTLSPISIPQLLMGESTDSHEDELQKVAELLYGNKEMLDEYFQIVIDEDCRLICLPMIVQGYSPDLQRLRQFLFDLALNVNWTEEASCFRQIAIQISKFYRCSKSLDEKYKWVLEHCVFPCFKAMFFPKREEGLYYELTNLQSLYRVFERC